MAAAASSGAIWTTSEWAALKEEVTAVEGLHLRELLKDSERCEGLMKEARGIVMDMSRQRVTGSTMSKLLELARAAGVEAKRDAMFAGEHINRTEDRAVAHVALRCPEGSEFVIDGKDVVPEVRGVLERVKAFTEAVRSGSAKGSTGKVLKNVVSIGIGGSYLGPEFVFEALRADGTASAAAEGRSLRFLANVDPVDVHRALHGLDAEETLVVIVSKTFTTAETMLNARTVRDWLVKNVAADAADVVSKHIVAVSAAVARCEAFGIDAERVFGFWDWVGGRYSVCATVGMVPLSLQYSFGVMERFLAGAHDMDEHFRSAPLGSNLPVLLGLLGVWNSSFLEYPARALLPYSQALLRFPAHVQQLDMESNGKRVTVEGDAVPFPTGELDFGEPGTNGQHSFYQLIHQGRVIPCDFLGFVESQRPVELEGETVSNHDELMSNFFAQPDALAVGRSAEDLKAAGVPDDLVAHKTFPGNRPSTSILLPRLDAFTCGQLLALYEHRTAVQGFVWGIPSFDQWGVELGKVLARTVRSTISAARASSSLPADDATAALPGPTKALLKRYLGVTG